MPCFFTIYMEQTIQSSSGKKVVSGVLKSLENYLKSKENPWKMTVKESDSTSLIEIPSKLLFKDIFL